MSKEETPLRGRRCSEGRNAAMPMHPRYEEAHGMEGQSTTHYRPFQKEISGLGQISAPLLSILISRDAELGSEYIFTWRGGTNPLL